MLERWEGFFLFPFKASSDQLHFSRPVVKKWVRELNCNKLRIIVLIQT